MSTPTLAFKSAAALAEPDSAPLVEITDEGVVTAVVSVTGVVDEVDDIIEPGAYRETLLKRTPKVCWHHSWEHPIGRVLAIEELMPGDHRLPKTTRDGKSWPAEAGALVATMQMNMKSERGREAFEAIKFYSESRECEYSIGYKVPSGKSTRDGKGIRHIKAMDLFELSFVLFGAHTMTGTLALKAAVIVMHEVKAAGGSIVLSKKAVDDEFQRLMSEADPEDGLDPEADEPTDAGPDDQEALEIGNDEDDSEAALHAAALADPEFSYKTVSDADTGIDGVCPGCGDEVAFDTGNGWMRRDGSYSHDDGSTHSDHMPPPAEFKAEGGADKNRGGAENLRRSYVHGKIALQIGWGTDGDFMRCVAIAGKHMTDEQAKGYCNLRHQDAVGAPPGQGHPEGKAAVYDQPDTTAPEGDGGDAVLDDPKHTGVMVALYPTPEAAKKIMVRGGEDPDELHVTLAYLGSVTDPVSDGLTLEGATSQIVAACQIAAAQQGPLSGTVGGVGKFPDTGSGVPVIGLVDVVGLGALRESVVEALTDAGLPVKTDHGFTPHMTLGYNLDMSLIPDSEPVPVEFADLVIAVGGTHTRIHLGDDLGAEASGAPVAGAPMQGEQMAGDQMGKSYDPTIETGPAAGNKSDLPLASPKSFPRLAGTMEERAQAISYALNEALLGDLDEEDRKQRYISVDGTWNDRVICTVNNWTIDDAASCQSYEFPYEVNADGTVSLGEPTHVKLTVTAMVDDEDLEDVPVGDLLPIPELIEQAIRGYKSLGVTEIKAGRVLSASIAARLKSATEHLISVLAAGGIQITTPAEEDPASPTIDMETTAPSARGKALIPAADVASLLADIESITTP
jgi:HK97 family phage prohead protease